MKNHLSIALSIGMLTIGIAGCSVEASPPTDEANVTNRAPNEASGEGATESAPNEGVDTTFGAPPSSQMSDQLARRIAALRDERQDAVPSGKLSSTCGFKTTVAHGLCQTCTFFTSIGINFHVTACADGFERVW